ncbi:MAG: hypothetical protein AAB381_01200 [Patescibacteria group bacterium]
MKPVLRKDQIGAAKAIREMWMQSKHPDRWFVHDLVVASTEKTAENMIEESVGFLASDRSRSSNSLYVADCLATWGLKYDHVAPWVHRTIMKTPGLVLSVEGVITAFFEIFTKEEDDAGLFSFLEESSNFRERSATSTDFEVVRSRLSKAIGKFTYYSAEVFGNAAGRSRLLQTITLTTEGCQISPSVAFFPLVAYGEPKDLLTWIKSELLTKTFLSLSYVHRQMVFAGFAQYEPGLVIPTGSR